ncbi:PA1571 family protein [Pseudomonas sp. NPDC090755]|uniref:PA1571 family protein n=1 Tax=Pseudomonas sp. NPDC090755 TaxID=3364481 RepID=UPI00383B059C
MSLQQGKTEQATAPKSEAPKVPVCGSIIGPDGQEVPITEDMIQKACEKLEKSRAEPTKKA